MYDGDTTLLALGPGDAAIRVEINPLAMGSGGESAVHRIQSVSVPIGGAFQHPRFTAERVAAKIWKTPGEARRAAKTRFLVDHPIPTPQPNRIARPLATLHSLTGLEQTLGFVMPLLGGDRWRPINAGYNPALARLHGLSDPADPALAGHRLTIAANLSRLVHTVHQAGHVISDLNESNVLVDPDGAVALIDVDSWQVNDPEQARTWNCPVGRPEYTAPETLRRLGQECREPRCAGCSSHRTGHACIYKTVSDDAFALAVLIFKILMAGEDPFGQPPRQDEQPGHLAANDNRAEERIKSGLFRYGRRHYRCCGPRNDNARRRWKSLPRTVRDLLDAALGQP